MHFAAIAPPVCAYVSLLTSHRVSQPSKVIVSFFVHPKQKCFIPAGIIKDDHSSIWDSNGSFWTISAVYRSTISSHALIFFIPRYNDFNIPLTVSLLVCWAGSRRFHQQSCAWHSSSKVCPGNRQLYTHLHLLGMPTGWTSTSSYPHCYFWLAYNASITSLSPNRKSYHKFRFQGNHEECWRRE